MPNSLIGSPKVIEEHTLTSPIPIVNYEEEEENNLESPEQSGSDDIITDAEIKALVKKLKSRAYSAKVPQWQLKLTKMCRNIDSYLQPGLIKIKASLDELSFPVLECSSGKFEQLLNTWLMVIRLTLGKIHVLPGNNDTVASEVCTKLTRLAMAAITTLQAHKRIFKPIVRHLEFVHRSYSKYLIRIGKCQSLGSNNNIDLEETKVLLPSFSDKFNFGDCSASIAILEREIILVHDQDRSAAVLVLKEYTEDYSAYIEILKIFMDHTTDILTRSKESLQSLENNLPFDVVFVRKVTDELLMSLLNFKKAKRFQDNMGLSPALKMAMHSLNETIHKFIDEIDEIRQMNIWVLTAVEACFKKIKDSWQQINFDIQSVYQDSYRKALVVKWNPWWHPNRLFGLTNVKFWKEVCEDVGKFEKYFHQWGTGDHLHLVNLRVPIPYELSPLLFEGREEVEVELTDSDSETSHGRLQKTYSDVLDIPQTSSSPPVNKGRRYLKSLSHFKMSICNIDLDPSKHSELPTLDQSDMFYNESNNVVVHNEGEISATPSDTPEYSLASNEPSIKTKSTLSSIESLIAISSSNRR